MKTLLTVAMFCLASNLFAQSTNINVFSDKGERFWVIINGIKQNTKASQHVKITNLMGDFWKMRVVFENQNIPEISQNVGSMEKNQELTYQVKQNRKGAFVIRMFSITPISSSGGNNAETTVPYHPTENPDNETTREPNNPAGFSLNVNDKGMDIKVNVEGFKTDISAQDPYKNNTNTSPNFNNNTNNNSGNCWQAMGAMDFSNAKKAVKSESFEENKIQVAQQFTKNNCLTVNQITEVLGAFTFEETKLEYAKYAYDFCYDKANYYQLNSAFTFSNSKDELNEFLKTK